MNLIRMVRRRRPALVHDAAADIVEPPPLVAQAPVIEADMVGHIDVVGAGRIAGWAASKADRDACLTVRLYLDDRLCAEGEAAHLRADVAAAGFGQGRHGFDLPVPTMALICAERLTLAALAGDGSEVACCTKLLRQPARRGPPVLWMDASDLIEFLTGHRELSGIQRVQAGYLLGLGQASIAGTQVRICTRFRSSTVFVEVPYERFALLLRQAGDAALVPRSAWPARMRAFKESLDTRAAFRPGDTLFTLGAPWALDDHNEIVRCAKRHDGLRYLQIFYDLIPISMPEVVAAPLVPRFARSMAAMAMEAEHVFSISRHARDDLAQTLRRLGREAPETGIVPMGGSITDAEGGAGSGSGADLERLGLAGPFVLCVGTLEPRKNHALLFQVWRRLVARHGPEAVPRLVLVGRVGWYMDDFLRQLKSTGYVAGTILHREGVSNAELSALYDACLFTVFPSFSEGWGLPITESLARGKVCVCSNVTSMPEAGGTHALFIDPYDATGALELCERLIYEEGVLAGHEARLSDFHAPTWAEAAEGLRAQFAELLPRLDARPGPAPRKPVEPGRVYAFHDLEAASPEAGAMEVFRGFLDQEEALDLLVGWDWFTLDAACSWACGDEAALRLPVPEGTGPLDAYLGLMVPPSCDGRLLDVSVDGASLGSCRVRTGPLTLSVPLPVRLPGPIGEHRLALRLAGRRLPGTEDRLLGLGIATLVLHRRDRLAEAVKLIQAGTVDVLESPALPNP